MRRKKGRSTSEIPQLDKDFQIYRSLKNLQKTTNPYAVSRLSSTKKPYPMSQFASPSKPKAPFIKAFSATPSKLQIPRISEEKSIQIAETIENQIREDVKHYSEIGEMALSGFREKVSLYNSYFTRFLFDNCKEFSRNDLVVRPFSLFANIGNDGQDSKDEVVSPQESIRRQNKLGSIFAVNRTETAKESPVSPSGKSKVYNFKESVLLRKGKPQIEFWKLRNLESRHENTNSSKQSTEKKEKEYKNHWEYYYVLGKDALKESQKKLEAFRKTFCPAGAQIDQERRIFLQMVKRNEIENVKILLEQVQKKEADYDRDKKLINTVDINMNQTALHWTAKRGLREMAELLLNNGINVFWKDFAQRTASDLARKNGFHELARRIEDFEFSQRKRGSSSFEIEKIDLNFHL